ncbi:enoyl-CoA hydratase [Caulobacter ginsengisoli]|uniref:Enoyl-CoA hydratase n=1 Tax=Caulobacter ginsengisoli TaxID=400775 RepID=A0ABU0IN04_9CAUL|nr:enoyl-CoA hydratase-related protein [Caulobacter ginsengisoli]MDQ0463389.1 enoyl-CoA hydratase [Caulobacter ginsengisoli]
MTPLQDYSRFRFDRDGRILTVTITGNAVNAVDAAMHDELARLFIELQADEGSDLIVLTGQGRAFCAGGDFDWFDEQIANPAKFRAIAHDAKRIVGTLLDLEKPIICRMNGAAAGLGATIALLCDVIIAEENARIGDPHVKVGLVAGDGGAVIWPQLIGFAKAKELLMTGELIGAREAVGMGLINYAVPADQLDAKVAEIAGKILANPRWAVRWTKTVANIALKQLAVSNSDAAVAYEMLSNMTADRAEAVNAFRERRPPRLTGE